MLPSLCQLSLKPATAGFLPEGKPQKGAPGCERDVVKRARDGSEIIHEVVDGCDCAICFQPLSKSDPNGAPYILADSCRHQFHWQCIYGWLRTNKSTCPTCRQSILQADINDILEVANDDTSYSTEEWIENMTINPDNLVFVPTSHANYGAIALAAVTQKGHALQFVRTDRPDYREIALAAVAQTGRALNYVPAERADYGAIALAAVAQDGEALGFVPAYRADYREIALVAVAQDGYALEVVPTEHADYGAIALVAVAQKGDALGFVPTDRADYGAIALAAVAQDGEALGFVPSDHVDYREIALASQR
jgi:hypothetical protein